MQLEKLLKFIEESSFSDEIELTKIPNINLYMDQALTFMNENLEFYRRNPSDKIFTKSMINNYVKNNIIPKPENKKYFPQHIISLIYIFYMKQVLALDDVKCIFESYSKEHFTLEHMTDMYEIFLDIERNETGKLKKEVECLSSDVYLNECCKNFDDDEKLFLLISLLASKANTYKVLIEKLLDFNY